MANYMGWVDPSGKVIHVYDGNGCFDPDTGKCYCADCYRYGDSVNCIYAGISDDAKPVEWNGSKWVIKHT